MAVIISDTFGRPWREGAINVAIGIAGIEPRARDYRGQNDAYGRPMQSTVIVIADELASAADLVMGKVRRGQGTTHGAGRQRLLRPHCRCRLPGNGVPVSLIKGYSYRPADVGIKALIRAHEQDLWRITWPASPHRPGQQIVTTKTLRRWVFALVGRITRSARRIS